ncbi:MAG: c-type cytochrome [Gemmatimonadota bacterium]
MAWRSALLGAVAVLAVGSVGGIATVFSGAVNVAATEPGAGPTEWLLGTAMERSVRSRAAAVGESIVVDSALLVHGFEHYHAMCVDCHGAPGVERGEYGQGLHPEPPDLAEGAHDWTERELFWITKYGIRMTGMPGFGPTHSDEELWAIVAAVRRIAEMDPEAYAEMIAAGSGDHSHDQADGDHTHAPGTPPHEH